MNRKDWPRGHHDRKDAGERGGDTCRGTGEAPRGMRTNQRPESGSGDSRGQLPKAARNQISMQRGMRKQRSYICIYINFCFRTFSGERGKESGSLYNRGGQEVGGQNQ